MNIKDIISSINIKNYKITYIIKDEETNKNYRLDYSTNYKLVEIDYNCLNESVMNCFIVYIDRKKYFIKTVSKIFSFLLRKKINNFFSYDKEKVTIKTIEKYFKHKDDNDYIDNFFIFEGIDKDKNKRQIEIHKIYDINN